MPRVSLPSGQAVGTNGKIARIMRELDTDPELKLTDHFTSHVGTAMRAVVERLCLPHESVARMLRRLICDDLARCDNDDLRDRRLTAFRPLVPLPSSAGPDERPYVLAARLTEEQYLRADLRRTALALTRGEYLDMLVLRAQTLKERGVTIAEDEGDLWRDRKIF